MLLCISGLFRLLFLEDVVEDESEAVSYPQRFVPESHCVENHIFCGQFQAAFEPRAGVVERGHKFGRPLKMN